MSHICISFSVVHQRFHPRDVVFLLDGSDGSRNYFPAMLEFTQSIVERINVSEGRDHVSVVQFSSDPVVHFYLNTYTTKESILNTIRGLRHKGGRPLKTGMALQYVRDNVFSASSGSRRLQGVPQVLILLSGGRSFDNVDMAASSLKELGVLIFAVGSVGSDFNELQKIANDPSSTFSVKDFTYLPSVQGQLLSVINTGTKDTTSTSLTEIGKPINLVLSTALLFKNCLDISVISNIYPRFARLLISANILSKPVTTFTVFCMFSNFIFLR